jgi:hypothetical protein
MLLGALAVTGCTALAGPSASPAPAPSPGTSSAPAPVPAPTPEPGQLAIATFDNTETPSISESVTGPAVMEGEFRIDGQCRGGSFSFRLRDATVGATERDIVSGKIVCGDPGSLPELRYDLGADGGPVQMVIVDSDDATQGWVRAIRTD